MKVTDDTPKRPERGTATPGRWATELKPRVPEPRKHVVSVADEPSLEEPGYGHGV